MLSEEVLAEVPDQIVGYMLENDINPGDTLKKKPDPKKEEKSEKKEGAI
jgi:hypothetical protein